MARSPGTGSITPIKSGHWVRITLADGSRKSLGVHKDPEFARQVLDAALLQLAETHQAPIGAMTLRVYGERWLHRRRHVLRLDDADGDEGRWRRHVLDVHFIDWPLENITRRDGRRFMDALAVKRVSPKAHRGKGRISRGTKQHVLNLVSKCLSDAAEDGLIPMNPLQGMRLETEERTHDPWTYLLPEEQDRISACNTIPEPHRLMIEIKMGTGIRLGEMNNLEIVDVHAGDAHPHMMIRYGKKGRRATKSKKFRRVELFGIALRAMRRWLEILPTWCKKNAEGLVFPGRRGGRKARGRFLQQSVWREVGGKKKQVKINRFDEYMLAAGIVPERRHDGRKVRHHDLRHTCASSLVAGWWGRKWSLQEVCKLLGHSSITVTQRYAHLADFEQQRAAQETTGRPAVVEPQAPPPAATERRLRLVR